jgi:phosphatidylserine/phosphatidylglycerophosphate/cardiolipin synthase-like enzyme
MASPVNQSSRAVEVVLARSSSPRVDCQRLDCPLSDFLSPTTSAKSPSQPASGEQTYTKMGLDAVMKKNMDRMSRLGVAIQTTINPNHRHDEKWEQEEDKIREEICESHRFRSFANIRNGNAVKWYSDGHDYFWALSEMFEAAKECIFVSVYLELKGLIDLQPLLNRLWTGGCHPSSIFDALQITSKGIE